MPRTISIRRLSILGALGAATALAVSGLVATPAMAAAPDAAVLVAPASGSTSATGTPALQVRATDPDGGPLQVRFEGRKAGATVPTTPGAPFTIVAIPDTQNYTYLNRQGTITAQTQWIVNTRSQLNTAFVVQLGDLVSDYPNATEWGYSSAGEKVLDDAGVPNAVVPGNHDFDNATGSVVPFDNYYPPSRYLGATWSPSTARYGGYLGENLFGPDPIDRRNFDNFSLFSAGGQDFLVLGLEWEAPQYALDWADKVISAYPDRTVIMFTHSFVSINGNRMTVPQRPGGTPTASLWSDFVATHCSIKLVLSGHEHNGDAGEARRTDNNNCGQPVQQILTDYQDRANGGNGWLRYYTFDPASGTMQATTYSPTLNQTETDADSSFTLPFPLGSQTSAPFLPIATVTATSGTTAQAAWTGLDPNTSYEWRAVVGDGTSFTTSSTWTVSTPPRTDIVDDTFSRTIAGGWGSTDTGQGWTLSAPGAQYAVGAGVGTMTLPPSIGRAVRLASVAYGDTSVVTDVAVTPPATGSGTYVSVMERLNGGNSYRAKLQFAPAGVVNLILTRVTTAETTITWQKLPGTYTAGQLLRVRFESIGSSPTTLRARAWSPAATEPTTWLTTTDSTAGLQSPAAVGIDTYQSSGATATAVVSVDRFTVSGPGGVPVANIPPVAAMSTPVISGRTVSISSTSTDSDGSIATTSWTFGDGVTSSGTSATHTYAADGTYLLTLTVTDNLGSTTSTSRSVAVSGPVVPVNADPIPVIDPPTVSGRTITVSGAHSTDPDGSVVGWTWDFGDGASTSGATASHSYAADGTYTVVLAVTDDDGSVAATSQSVTVAAAPPPPPPANSPPVAVIGTPSITGRTVSVSGSGSTDSDGTVTGYAWDFGDGTTAGGATATRTYVADGTYTISLTVTDDDGAASATVTRVVTVAAPPPPPANAPPVAVIGSPVISGRTVTVSGAGSTDIDGTVTAYAWSFGDGTTATGASASRTYPADGTFVISLTVTDDDGASATVTRSVTVSAPPPPPPTGLILSDDFSRTVVNGWGSADLGGAWTANSTASRYAVSGGVGQHRLTAAGSSADTMIPSLTSKSAELRGSVSWNRTAAAGALYACFIPRAVNSNSDYRLRVSVASNGVPTIILVRLIGGAETNLVWMSLPGITVTANTWYSVAVRAVPSGSSTRISGKFWVKGTTEPAAWQLTTTDATASLQGVGYPRLNTYMSSAATAPVTASFDDLRFSTVAP